MKDRICRIFRAFRSVGAPRLTALFLVFALLLGGMLSAHAENEGATPPPSSLAAEDGSLSLDCKSAVLMDAATGTILYTQNADEALPPASVTKIMTLLLVMEAIDGGRLSLDDQVTASANAASMGGSQVYLKEGETMTVEEMLKSVIISSANDAAVALAEHIAGDVTAFVALMNKRAEELGMTSTRFENVTGLDDTAEHHLTSARDIALMSRALIAHPTILKYSSIWMDTIRGGAFGLTNTNRLIRFYRGATGLKTGSTSKAGFCISATAERDGLSLICVIMGAQSRDIRNAQASRLLDWGFANYAVYHDEGGELEDLRVLGGVKNVCPIAYDGISLVLFQKDVANVKSKTVLPEHIAAPVKKGDCVGKIEYYLENQLIGQAEITARETVEKISFPGLWERLIARMLLM